MKKYLMLVMVLLIGVVMFSCDDDEATKDSPLKFNDQTFNWNDNAELWYYSAYQYYNMNLFTGSLFIDYDRLSGIGDYLSIEFYVPTQGVLSAGEYILSDTEDEWTCDVVFDFNVDASGQYSYTERSVYFTTGTVKVEGSGENYKVTIDVTDGEGNSLKGTYSSYFRIENVN